MINLCHFGKQPPKNPSLKYVILYDIILQNIRKGERARWQESVKQYIEYVPYDKQVEFYKSNIVPYEQLVKQLKLAEDNLQQGNLLSATMISTVFSVLTANPG